ncbi:NAD(P)-dependent methylenetetrahydromethanopterin dehydrogenase [Xanthobacter sp. TB0139]|uniref:NAD(P)-dependent methylenetetrahydromethanopterin dehydrogenase n=1 Tax=Xanthobacter sp. TB0139 TaxID=3459178 RepID=UPI0040395DFA
MAHSLILHLFTSSPNASPFDVNMAIDAGYQHVIPYTGVESSALATLTQDAIFSRSPKDAVRTGIFIGGRDALEASDFIELVRGAMVPPFIVSVMADPSGAYTTAAAQVAAVEHHLKVVHGLGLAGRRVLILSGTGPVGRIAAVLAAQAGADVTITSYRGLESAKKAAEETGGRFGVTLKGASGKRAEDVRVALDGAEIVLATAAAGVEVLSRELLQGAADHLLVAADINAVPPAGIADVGVFDDGKPIEGMKAVGIGALAIGNVKYQTQHRLLARMCTEGQPLTLSFAEAFAMARNVLAESAAKP